MVTYVNEILRKPYCYKNYIEFGSYVCKHCGFKGDCHDHKIKVRGDDE